MTFTKDDSHAINTIRVLAADTVFKSNSGHPGQCPDRGSRAHVYVLSIFSHDYVPLS